MRLIATAFTFGLCSISARGHAESRVATPPPSHAKSATDSSDRIYEELVAAADADGNGSVSHAELASLVLRHVEKQAAERFQRLDRNADGRVTESEVPTMVPERFARFDSNRDGGFTLIELAKTLREQALQRCRAVFARLDVDKDEALSAADAGAARPTRVAKR
jgi:Ca2+-binding EF-hand superfamily protein